MIYIGGDNIKKYPIVMQEESKDCGVACIQMIIKYYGGYVKKSNLLELTKTGKRVSDSVSALADELNTIYEKQRNKL